jgi:repressor LexA
MTKLHSQILNFIREFIASKGYVPSGGEIAEAVSVSKATVHYNLRQLEERGFIRRGRGWRAIELTNKSIVARAA